MNKKLIYSLAAVVLIAAGAAIGAFWGYNTQTAESESVPEMSAPPMRTETPKPAEQASEEAEEYISPVDFELLWQTNDEIIAWLDIPGANISYPILQSPTDNAYYLDHNVERKHSAGGALFTESYNSKEFTDNVTLVYGHHMNDRSFFSTLQAQFSDSESFKQLRDITVYTPYEQIDYKVFAAVPYSNAHILFSYDFNYEFAFDGFMDEIYSTRSLGSNFDETLHPRFSQRVIVLSTCLAGDSSRRYLVLGVEAGQN